MNEQDRNKLIIGAVLIIMMLFVILYQWQSNMRTNQASIDYWIDTNAQTRFYRGGGYSMIQACCFNGGDMAGSFYLILKFTNATVALQQTGMYNSTLVKLPFSLQKSGSGEDTARETVIFYIDNDVSGFSIFISLERQNQDPLEANALHNQLLQCNWNNIDKWYEIPIG
jgi:hypothetical protein